MTPRPDVSLERKNQILDAAIKVFSRLGFTKARMDDIGVESGLSKGALYWYYQSKDEIILAILDRIFERELADMQALQVGEKSATERLLLLGQLVIEDMNHMLKMLPIAYEFLALAFREETVQEYLKNYFRAYLESIVPIIQQGIDNGEFRPVDAFSVAIALGAIFEGTVLLWVYDSETIQIEAHIMGSMQLLLDGLRA